MEDRGDELDLLLVALRELLRASVLVLGDAEARQPLAAAPGGFLARDGVERGEEDELLEDLHAGVEAALLGQVAPGAPSGRPSVGVPSQVAVPLSGRRMSRTIRIVVVLPAPFAPRKPKTWPGSTLKLMPSRAVTLPKRLTRLSRTRLMPAHSRDEWQMLHGPIVTGGRGGPARPAARVAPMAWEPRPLPVRRLVRHRAGTQNASGAGNPRSMPPVLGYAQDTQPRAVSAAASEGSSCRTLLPSRSMTQSSNGASCGVG